MTSYLSFLALVMVLNLAPGPDMAITLRAALTRGRSAGLWTLTGVGLAAAVQGLLAAGGLGAIIVASEPLFLTIKWVGAGYLLLLGLLALRSARRGLPEEEDAASALTGGRRPGRRALVQGLLCNITNPKVLAFNLAVLPQFVGAGAGTTTLVLYALSLAVLGSVVLLGVVLIAGRARAVLASPRMQRRMEGVLGVTMIGFGANVAAG